MTQEEYKARRKELQDQIFDCRKKERQEIQNIEDDKRLAHRNAADKIRAFTQRVEQENMEAIRYLNKHKDEIRRKYASMRAELDNELKVLDAELRRAYYVDLKEGGKA